MKIREATVDDAPALARILVDTNRATFGGLVPEPCLDFPYEESERNWRKSLQSGLKEGQFLLVAENDSGTLVALELAGSYTGRDDFPRELDLLMVDTSYQRRGIGRLLVAIAAQRLLAEGDNAMLVGVQEDNPNRAFYERLGAREVGWRPLNWEGYETRELLYGWEDISELPAGRDLMTGRDRL